MEESKEDKKVQNLGQIVKNAFQQLGETLKAFFTAPRALWGINLPYLLEGIVYFGILTEMEIFLSQNMYLTDPQATWVLSFLTGGITLAMVILGGMADKFGIRKALSIAFSTLLVGRILVSLSGTLPLGTGIFSPMFFVMIGGLLFIIIGYGLYQPAAYAGIKRYTTPKTKSMGYAVVYALMNLGAFLFGMMAKFVRDPFEKAFPPNGITAVFWVLTVINALALIFTVILLTKSADRQAYKKAKEARDKDQAEKEDNTDQDDSDSIESEQNIDNTWVIIYGLLAGVFLGLFILFKSDKFIGNPENPLHNIIYMALILLFGFLAIRDFLERRPEHPFRDMKFVFFIFILIPVQTLFAHNWLTIPPYLHRAFHGSLVAEYYEFFANINPLLIFILAPIVAGLTRGAKIYNMVVYGTFVMAIPTFLLAFEPNIYLFLTYILLMTIGEAMWQPRFLEWIAEIAPEGKTGAYMGIGQLPWFMTKVITGLYAGFFLSAYIPKDAPVSQLHPGQMWFFYALIAMVTPIALLLAKKWMTKEEM
ncbi:MAG: MFS transporter [Candidatus Marinimicrobia bacterium]|nr:MFS transporter [Candidatus Neomarinimicrobiota bacterium]